MTQLNGAQTASLLTVIQSMKDGALTEAQARSVIAVSLGVDTEKAQKIIRGEL